MSLHQQATGAYVASGGMARTKKSQSEELLDALHELRTIVLMECEGGHFHQIMLPSDKYKQLTTLVSYAAPKDADLREGFEMRGMDIKHGWKIDADQLIGLSSYYTRKDIAESRAAHIAEEDEDDDV